MQLTQKILQLTLQNFRLVFLRYYFRNRREIETPVQQLQYGCLHGREPIKAMGNWIFDDNTGVWLLVNIEIRTQLPTRLCHLAPHVRGYGDHGNAIVYGCA